MLEITCRTDIHIQNFDRWLHQVNQLTEVTWDNLCQTEIEMTEQFLEDRLLYGLRNSNVEPEVRDLIMKEYWRYYSHVFNQQLLIQDKFQQISVDDPNKQKYLDRRRDLFNSETVYPLDRSMTGEELVVERNRKGNFLERFLDKIGLPYQDYVQLCQPEIPISIPELPDHLLIDYQELIEHTLNCSGTKFVQKGFVSWGPYVLYYEALNGGIYFDILDPNGTVSDEGSCLTLTHGESLIRCAFPFQIIDNRPHIHIQYFLTLLHEVGHAIHHIQIRSKYSFNEYIPEHETEIVSSLFESRFLDNLPPKFDWFAEIVREWYLAINQQRKYRYQQYAQEEIRMYETGFQPGDERFLMDIAPLMPRYILVYGSVN